MIRNCRVDCIQVYKQVAMTERRDHYHARRRSLSEDSYDHLRRYRKTDNPYGKTRRPSPDHDQLYSHVKRRSRDQSPEDYYSRVRRRSLDGPPSELFARRTRRNSEDYVNGHYRRHSADFAGRRQYSDDYVNTRPGRNSLDSVAPVTRIVRRYNSDPYSNVQMSYGQVMPYGSTTRPGNPVLTQPAYTPVNQSIQPAYTRRVMAPIQSDYSAMNYVRRQVPVPVEYVDNPTPPVQYVQQPVTQRVQYIQRPIPQPVQYVEQPMPQPVRYVTRRAVVKPVEYVQRPMVVERPVVTRAVNRYRIEGDLTPVETGPGTIHLKYDNVRTNYDVMPMRNDVREVSNYTQRSEVREVPNYAPQPITEGRAYTAYYLRKSGGRADEDSSVQSSYRMTNGDRADGTRKELDHVLYHGNGKMTEVFEEADMNNNKNRIIR